MNGRSQIFTPVSSHSLLKASRLNHSAVSLLSVQLHILTILSPEEIKQSYTSMYVSTAFVMWSCYELSLIPWTAGTNDFNFGYGLGGVG